jgi:dihydrofolate synthase/folylpolyglutamate synthase
LQQKGVVCPESAIRSGMGSVRHPGRLEVLCTHPLCAVDIAHNAMGARTIARALPELFEYDHVIVVIGILHDKDVAEILRPFLEVAHSMIFTRPHLTERAESASAIADIAEKLVQASSTMTRNTYRHWIVCDSVEHAITKANQLAGIHDLIVVTGSNYTVSEAEIFYASQNCANIEDCR